MMRIFLILIAFTATTWALQQSQIIIEGDAVLPSEMREAKPTLKIVPPAPVPLEPREMDMKVKKGRFVKLTRENVRVTPQRSIPLTSPDVPNVIPMTTNPLDQYSKRILSHYPQDKQYRIMNMHLNDFGVAMSRRAGLRYIYNPAVRGTVNGIFKNTDPIHMLKVAGKSNGYKLVIKDGVKASFEKEEKAKEDKK